MSGKLVPMYRKLYSEKCNSYSNILSNMEVMSKHVLQRCHILLRNSMFSVSFKKCIYLSLLLPVAAPEMSLVQLFPGISKPHVYLGTNASFLTFRRMCLLQEDSEQIILFYDDLVSLF